MDTSNQQNKKQFFSNVKASAFRKELFGIDLLNFWKKDTENREELFTSCPKYLYEERFQIDRTRLRMMMQTSKGFQNKSEADIYFENIMKSTETQIEWPRSYKSDTKCKQHPFVRVCGSRLEDVTWAKGLVLANLQVNNSFLRLKMAISNADHLYILGRNNNNVNRIMDDTKTHIQFPDSNQMKKENQVIVYGTLDDLENARVLLRSSSPLLMSFELPMNQTIPFSDKVGAYYKVQVIFSASSKPNTSLVLIRGTVRRAEQIKEATRSLLNSAFGKFASSTIVSVQLEIPPHHQESVKGEDCANILAIMEQTNTKIFFPELPTRGYRKSQVIITGTIDEACMAREELVESFPIELTFDVPDENRSATEIMNFGKRAGLSITISQKERKYGMSVTIKGAERLMDKIYQVHRSILKLKKIFRNEKCMTKPLYFLKDAHHQPEAGLAMIDKIENFLQRNDLDMKEGRTISNEQFPVMSSPDSGYASQASYRDESQQNQWTVLDHQAGPNHTYLEPSAFKGLQSTFSTNLSNYHHSDTLIQPHGERTSHGHGIPSYIDVLSNSYKEHHLDMVDCIQEPPQIAYPSYSNHETNDWKISGHQGTEAIHHTSIQQIEENADIFPFSHQHKHLIHYAVPEQIYPNHHNQQYSVSNYVNVIKSGASSSSPLINSPLILGSEESVAGRLICTGWGNFV